jgi:hypothetical protein
MTQGSGGSTVLASSGQRAAPGIKYSSVETRGDSTVRHTVAQPSAPSHGHPSSGTRMMSLAPTTSGGEQRRAGRARGDESFWLAAAAERARLPLEHAMRNAILMRRAVGATKLAPSLRPGTAPPPRLLAVPKFEGHRHHAALYAPVFPGTAQRAPRARGSDAGAWAGAGRQLVLGADRRRAESYSTVRTVRSVRVTTTALQRN